MVEATAPVLNAPSPASFGIENFGQRTIRVALAPTVEHRVMHDGDGPLPRVRSWPRPTAYAVPTETAVLPVPAAQNFRYARSSRGAGAARHRTAAAKKPQAGPRPKEAHFLGGLFSLRPADRPRAAGHRLSVVRPPTSLTPQAR